MRQLTKNNLAAELMEQGVKKTQVAWRLGVSRRTHIRWSQAIEQHGHLPAFPQH
jgi:transposase